MNTYQILGIQLGFVRGINDDVARVRMYFSDKVVDEDFKLPELGGGVSPSEAIYEWLLRDQIELRMSEIETGNLDTAESSVDAVEKVQVEQIITEL